MACLVEKVRSSEKTETTHNGILSPFPPILSDCTRFRGRVPVGRKERVAMVRERGAQTRKEQGWNDGFSFKGCWSEWDADVVVTTRREVADIPLSFIKESFLSTFASLSFFLSLRVALFSSRHRCSFPHTSFYLCLSLSLYRHHRTAMQ